MMEVKGQVFLTAGTACAKAGALEAGCGRGVRRGVRDAGGQTTQALIGRVIKRPPVPPSSPQSFPVWTIHFIVSLIVEHIWEFGPFILRANERFVEPGLF